MHFETITIRSKNKTHSRTSFKKSNNLLYISNWPAFSNHFLRQEKKMSHRLMTLIIIVIITAFPVYADSPAPFTETLIPLGTHKAGESIYGDSLQTSPDHRDLAYVAQSDAGPRVWVDGVAGHVYERIGLLRYAPQGNRLAYQVQDNGRSFVVLDGQKGPDFSNVGTMRFSPDGSRFAYRAADKDDKQFVIIDGKQGPKFEGVPQDIIFSPDSKHVAYVGISSTGSHIFLLDHKKREAHDDITDITFSPDSRHVAYAAKKDGRWHVVKNNKIGPAYNNVGDITFSADSSHIAYTARKHNRPIVVKDGQEITADSGFLANPMFSPDGSRFVYLLLIPDEQELYVVIDGERGPACKKLGSILFSPDGKHWAYSILVNDRWTVVSDKGKGPDFDKIRLLLYLAHKTAGNFCYIGVENGKECLVTDGKQSQYYDSVGMPLTAPETGDTAYVAKIDDKMAMIINGQEPEKKYDIIGILRPTPQGEYEVRKQLPFFAPAGDRLAYPVIDNHQAFMIVDGKKQGPYDNLDYPVFSPDGRHIAYVALQAGEWVLVIDGQESKYRFDNFLPPQVTFESPTHCYILGVRTPPPSFFRLEIEFPSSEES